MTVHIIGPMAPPLPPDVDVVIIGGGVAGLWLLGDVADSGRSALLIERAALGSGQTVASQGIIHGGLKYALGGILTSSARAIREMPARWQQALDGEGRPDLSGVELRAEGCHLWQTKSLRSRLGFLGAKAGLRAPVEVLEGPDRPAALAACPGAVARVHEPVLDPASMIEAMAAPFADRILLADASITDHDVTGATIELTHGDHALTLRTGTVVLTAGAGNEAYGTGPMQRRPLHMIVGRGNLPIINGHCVDGRHTRATIVTSTRNGVVTWQVGGQVAEDGVDLEPDDLIRHTVEELRAILPGVDFTGTEWSTYRVDRAEPAAGNGHRPDEPGIVRDGSVITAWPTKLALAPLLAERIMEELPPPADSDSTWPPEAIRSWPHPPIADPPWEEARWIAVP